MACASGILITYSGYPYTPSSMMPDNGLANLAGALIKNGHKVLILDYCTADIVKRLMPQDIKDDLTKLLPLLKNSKDHKLIDELKAISAGIEAHREKEVHKIYKEIEEHIIRKKVNFIGFKLWMGDGFSDSIMIAELIKRNHPGIKIYGGGPQSQMYKETIYGKTHVFDALCYGEGEEIISLLADHSINQADLKDIPNIIYFENDKIITNPLKRIEELDNIAYPVYDADVYPACDSNDKIKIFSLDASRGCPNNCAFCVHSSISGHKIRNKSVDRVFNEIKFIKQKYNSKAFRFSGSYTPANILTDLSALLIKEKVEIIYTAFSTLQDMNDQNIPILKSAGLSALYVGIESADERILKDDFEKKFNPEKAKPIIKDLIDAGIFMIASFIYPAPSENAESTNKSLNYILELFSDPQKTSVTIHHPGVLPLGKWAENPKKYGFEINNFEEYKNIGMTYNIKQYLPHYLWEKLPFKVYGKDHSELLLESGKFMKEIESRGVLTMLLDEAVLMAHLNNQRPMDFKNLMKNIFFTGDYESLHNSIIEINKNLSAKLKAAEERPRDRSDMKSGGGSRGAARL
ncbi:MAG TPA: radical SAM protein [Smithella sp.]|nr:radical SAM protein [Smithella sp.]